MTVEPKTPKTKVIKRYLRKQAVNKLATGKRAISQLASVNELRQEIELLTSYSTDTIYRLRYAGMHYDYISPNIVRLLGYTPEEMKRLSIRSLILETRIVTDSMRPVQSFTPLEENRKKGGVNKWQADYLMRTKDGRTIWVSDVSYPWFDEKGSIIGSVGSLRDITDRVEAERTAQEELLRLSTTDNLTGLANRKNFFIRLEEELKRIRRSHGDLSVLLLDVDHLRRINDEHGNGAGDAVIAGVARIITSCLRETDVGARLGGEEFGVFLPDTPAAGAYWVADRIRANVAKQVFRFGDDGQQLMGCTISIGLASAKYDQNMDAHALYKAADTRLYIAKHTGRNQVSMDELVGVH